MPLMSSPLAATSVAMTTVTSPALNRRMVASRWLWERSPLMESAARPAPMQCLRILATVTFVFANTMIGIYRIHRPITAPQ
eukprot:714630-Pyramimonas_sp.AAC.1